MIFVAEKSGNWVFCSLKLYQLINLKKKNSWKLIKTNILFRVDDFPCPTLGYTLVFFGSLYIKRLHISWGPEFPVQKFVTTFGHKPETTKSLEIL